MGVRASEAVKVEINFAPDVFVTMQMIGLYGDKLEREMRKATAVDLFRRGLLSIGKAAELASMCLADFMEILRVNDVPVVDYTIENFEKDLETLEKVKQ